MPEVGPARPARPTTGFELGIAELLARRQVAVSCVVLVQRHRGTDRAQQLAADFPAARVHVLVHGNAAKLPLAEDDDRVSYRAITSNAERLTYLSGFEPPQLVVDASRSRPEQSLHVLRHLYFRLAPGGLFVLEGAAPAPEEEGLSSFGLLAAAAALPEAELDLAARAPVELRDEVRATSTELVFRGDQAMVTKSTRPEGYHLLKLRDWESDETLTRRFGTGWGRTLLTRPARTFAARGEVTSHGDGPLPSGTRTYEVPELHLRAYSEVVCSARQVVRLQDYLLPDTWRHPHQGVLNNIALVTSTRHFARFRPAVVPSPPRRLRGSYYYLDTMFPGHFGHVTTEVLGRVWGWAHAVAADPEVRPLISERERGDFYPFQRQIFDALGIPADRTVVIPPEESVQVERLYAASPELENPHYVAPELEQVFRRLAEELPPATSPVGEKLFVSRRTGDKRHCTNSREVEEFFREEGFAVVYPEDHAYPEQRAMFAAARVIAGFGGSAMFNMMFAPGARVLVISSRNYNAQNERLLAAVNGIDLHYLWGDPEIEAPLNRYRRDAFRSHYHLDLTRYRQTLQLLVR
ncbi:DUF563 domain-containing protein [uncultured Friedmanniella sp.]|uniref:glycosyltransferase family 61 protein n=1 Tax=uncultured Friedmanniella sp. TaxID=335381 RepID=UPI0035C94E03